jgi:hypothetical protein
MKNKIDYYTHTLFTPSFYHRQYENDLPQEKKEETYTEGAKRVIHIALPFLSLYRPFGTALSLSMGTARILTSGVGVVNAKSWPKGAEKTLQLGLASLALIGTLYNFTLGLYLTTGADLVANLAKIVSHLHALEYQRAGEEFLQALGSGLYLAIMMTASLEVVVASLLVQALVCIVQASSEWKEGRMPEAMAKVLMGMTRLYQAHGQIELIQRRNALVEQYQDLQERISRGRKVNHIWNHPLQNLNEKIDEQKVIFEDANENAYDFGSHFFGYGKQQVKGMNLTFTEQGKETALEFKINHLFRDRLEILLQNLKTTPKKDLQQLLDLNQSHITGVSITRFNPNEGKLWNSNEKYRISLQGLGTISIGSNPDVVTNYDRVSVQMEKGKSLYDFHEALAFLGLDDALKQSTAEDIERMKLGHLFHMFAPKAATHFERSHPFFDLPLEELKQEMIARSPKMEEYFKRWLPHMQLREILPGRVRFALDGLFDELRMEGARGLTAAIFGDWFNKNVLYERVASMLKMGMLSHEMRERHGMTANGLSGGFDYYTGGADSVFTQIVTKNNKSYYEHVYASAVRLTIDPKILEMGTYQFHEDNFGNRQLNNGYGWLFPYTQRDNIHEFLKIETGQFNFDNEVMIKDRIPPEYFKGIVVENWLTKQGLLQYLKEKNLVQIDGLGRETILSRPVDEFIHVGDSITDAQFA